MSNMPEISRFFGIGIARMYFNVISAEYVDGYRLKVAFEDGTSGVVDLEP